MTGEELARIVTASIARHQTRGLVYNEAAIERLRLRTDPEGSDGPADAE